MQVSRLNWYQWSRVLRVIVLGVVICSCHNSPELSDGVDTADSSESSSDDTQQMESDTGVGDTDSDTDCDTDIDSDSDTNTGSDSDVDTGADTHEDVDTSTGITIDTAGWDTDYAACGDSVHLGNAIIQTTEDSAQFENITDISGNLYIVIDQLDSLPGLDSLECVGGNMHVFGTGELSDLQGLHNLQTIYGSVFLGQIENISDAFYSDSNCVPSGLGSLSGLESVGHIGGSLSIVCADNLTTLTGLNNLASIDEDLIIGQSVTVSSGGYDYLNWYGNSSLVDLSGLESLTSIGGGLRVEGNEALTTLAPLASASGSIGGDVRIRQNPKLENLLGLQNALHINGNVIIANNDGLQTLQGLDNLQTVTGTLSIGTELYYAPDVEHICQLNSILTDLTALSNIQQVGTFEVACNPMLSSFTLIGNPDLEKLSISRNSALESVAFPDLASVSTMSISYNANLLSIGPFEALEEITESLLVVVNSSLPTCEAVALREQPLVEPWLATCLNDNLPDACPDNWSTQNCGPF